MAVASSSFAQQKVQSFAHPSFPERGQSLWIPFHLVALGSQLLFKFKESCDLIDYWTFSYCSVLQYSFSAFCILSEAQLCISIIHEFKWEFEE